MQFKSGDIVYHQNTGSTTYQVSISYIEQSELIRIDSGERLLCDNQYLMTKGDHDMEMRDRILDSLLNEEEVKDRMRREA